MNHTALIKITIDGVEQVHEFDCDSLCAYLDQLSDRDAVKRLGTEDQVDELVGDLFKVYSQTGVVPRKPKERAKLRKITRTRSADQVAVLIPAMVDLLQPITTRLRNDLIDEKDGRERYDDTWWRISSFADLSRLIVIFFDAAENDSDVVFDIRFDPEAEAAFAEASAN